MEARCTQQLRVARAGESKDVELISSTDLHWGDATGCVLAEDLGGDEWVVPFTILEEHAGASPRLYVAAGKITRARHLETDTRNLVHYLRHAALAYTPSAGPPRWRRLFRS